MDEGLTWPGNRTQDCGTELPHLRDLAMGIPGVNRRRKVHGNMHSPDYPRRQVNP